VIIEHSRDLLSAVALMNPYKFVYGCQVFNEDSAPNSICAHVLLDRSIPQPPWPHLITDDGLE